MNNETFLKSVHDAIQPSIEINVIAKVDTIKVFETSYSTEDITYGPAGSHDQAWLSCFAGDMHETINDNIQNDDYSQYVKDVVEEGNYETKTINDGSSLTLVLDYTTDDLCFIYKINQCIKNKEVINLQVEGVVNDTEEYSTEYQLGKYPDKVTQDNLHNLIDLLNDHLISMTERNTDTELLHKGFTNGYQNYIVEYSNQSGFIITIYSATPEYHAYKSFS